jgi:hypothetical protein
MFEDRVNMASLSIDVKRKQKNISAQSHLSFGGFEMILSNSTGTDLTILPNGGRPAGGTNLKASVARQGKFGP